MVFKNLIRKGDLGGFGLENLGDVGSLNGRVQFANHFTPTELREPAPPQQTVEEIEDDVEQDDQVQPQQQQAPEPQANFFGESGTQGENDFFGKPVAVKESKVEESGFFGKPKDNKVNTNFFGKEKQNNPDTVDFFGSEISKKSRAKVRAGITNNANIFGDKIKIKRNKPLIGSLKEGVDFFDSSFNSKSDKPPIKRGTGFDNFIGDINLGKLARGKPDSAVPKTGIFSKQGRKGKGLSQPVDLSQMNQNLGVLPNPEGFEDFNVEESFGNGEKSIEEFEESVVTGKRAGRPKGSVGKKKRQARHIQKKKKKKKINELTKSRISVLKERERLKKGGTPRNAIQGANFKSTGVSPNTKDGSFRSFFT